MSRQMLNCEISLLPKLKAISIHESIKYFKSIIELSSLVVKLAYYVSSTTGYVASKLTSSDGNMECRKGSLVYKTVLS